MLGSLLFVLAPLASSPIPAFTPDASLASRLEVRIATDRSTILQSEPLPLTLSLTNVSTEEVIGFLTIHPLTHRTKVLYRRVGAPEMTTLSTGIRPGTFDPIVVLQPGGSTDPLPFLICFDDALGRSPFSEPGDYEIVAEFRPNPAEGNVVLRSNLLSITVEPPTGADAAALAAYEPRLAAVVQPEATGWIPEERLRDSLAFVKRFPTSPYARLVRGKAVTALLVRMHQPGLSADAKDDYERALAALRQRSE